MGIDPKSLAAFAAPNQGVRKQPDPVPGEEHDEPDDEAGELPVDARYEDLLQLLEQHATEIQELSEELDSETLTELAEDIDEDEEHTLREGVSGLDKRLQAAMRASAEITIDDCDSLASHLAEDGVVEDEERFSGWLYRACRVLGG